MPRKRSLKSRIKTLKGKKKEAKLSTIQTFIVLLPLIILVIFLIIIGWLAITFNSVENSEIKMPITLSNKEYNSGPQYPIYDWKTYTNEKLGFSVEYPAQGYLQDPSCKNGACMSIVHLGTCGNEIKEDNLTKSSSFISFDNMFGIIINNYNGSIDNFIISQGGNPNDFSITSSSVKGADDAIYLSLKENSGMTPPIPSIVNPAYIIKKGDYIYQIAPLQNFGSIDGCLPPAGTDANSFKSAYWNIPASLLFD